MPFIIGKGATGGSGRSSKAGTGVRVSRSSTTKRKPNSKNSPPQFYFTIDKAVCRQMRWKLGTRVKPSLGHGEAAGTAAVHKASDGYALTVAGHATEQDDDGYGKARFAVLVANYPEWERLLPYPADYVEPEATPCKVELEPGRFEVVLLLDFSKCGLRGH